MVPARTGYVGKIMTYLELKPDDVLSSNSSGSHEINVIVLLWPLQVWQDTKFAGNLGHTFWASARIAWHGVDMFSREKI